MLDDDVARGARDAALRSKKRARTGAAVSLCVNGWGAAPRRLPLTPRRRPKEMSWVGEPAATAKIEQRGSREQRRGTAGVRLRAQY